MILFRAYLAWNLAIASEHANVDVESRQSWAQPLNRLDEPKLDALMLQAQRSARRWSYAWIATFGALSVGQIVLTALPGQDTQTRVANGLGIVAPVVGGALTLFDPLPALRARDDHDWAASTYTHGPSRMAAKRSLLRTYARAESKQRQGWFSHMGPILLNGSIAAVNYWVLHRPTQAVIALGAGVAISELKIWTSPRRASRLFRRQ